MRPPLPLYSRCVSSRTADVTVPDFTFAAYPEISSSTSNGWTSVAKRLRAAGAHAAARADSPAARQRRRRAQRTVFWRGEAPGGARVQLARLANGVLPAELAAVGVRRVCTRT